MLGDGIQDTTPDTTPQGVLKTPERRAYGSPGKKISVREWWTFITLVPKNTLKGFVNFCRKL